MHSFPLPPTRSLLPPSHHLLPTLALLFEPGAAPHVHQTLLLASHPTPHDSYRHYTTYHTLITHIRAILESLLSLSSSSSPPINNNKGKEGGEKEENLEAYAWREIIKQIINAHPRLGCGPSGAPAAVVRVGNPSSSTKDITTISELSTQEQARLQQPAGKEAEEAELLLIRELNEEYEKRFHGLRFVTFVNGRGREEVVGEMRERLTIARGDRVLDDKEEEKEEMRVAIGAVCDIADDRVRILGVVGGD